MGETRRRTALKIGAVGAAAGVSGFLAWKFGLPPFTVSAAGEQTVFVEDMVPTACWIGKQDCGMIARRINGHVVKFEGDPAHPLNLGTLCPKGVAQIAMLYDPNRVQTPLIRTNGKGGPGEWRRASWDEALTLVADRINEVRARNPALILWQKGRSKASAFYDTAFVKAVGATKMGHGGYCSDAGYRAAEYTLGVHGVLHPDFRHTRYLLSWGWNITNAGGNKLCWITWPRQFLEARERGMKVVHIDPRLRGAGPHTDRWLPIRPATDLALALALCNGLIGRGYVDRDYLRKYTNAPFLVGNDGMFDRVGGVERVWDPVAGAPVPFDAAGVEPALEGEYSVGGSTAKPAYQRFKDHVAPYTPEWAAGVCGLPAEQIRTVVRELGENAMIGSTTVVDGVEIPYRPVSVMAYHMAQQELGFQAIRAMIMPFMLLGAFGAVGGPCVDFTWKIDKNYNNLDTIQIRDPPYNFYLKDSKFFPINTGLPGIVAKVMMDPARYDVADLPEMLIAHMVNPLASFPSQKDFLDSYRKFDFVAFITPFLSETADYFADVVLPTATIEKYEGPLSGSDQYTDAVALRLPPMPPLFDSKGDIDIYIDLCEKAGLLFGPSGYLDQVNQALGLVDPFALPLDRKPTVRDIFDRWAQAQGLSEGIVFFERQGVWVKGPVAATKYYGYATSPPFGGALHRLYGESLLRYQNEMKAKGATEAYWRDYTPLPTWRSPTMDGSPSTYDLYLISYKLVEFKQSRASFNPLLAELAPRQRLDIHPKTARARGIEDREEVWVESHNAITGETRRVKVHASFTEAIRPDTVGMPHHYGMWVHPVNRDQGPTPNILFYTGEGYVTNTADQSYHVKVRVYKDGGGP